MGASGSDSAFEEVYDELRRLAASWWRSKSPGSTLQPTALVHEAYLKLAGAEGTTWNDEEHFRAIAARALRQALVNHARDRNRLKRGGGVDRHVTLSGVGSASGLGGVDLLALDEALENLKGVNERHARIVELRFFGGLTEEQVASVIGLSDRTVRTDWRAARAWLLHRLTTDDGHGSDAV